MSYIKMDDRELANTLLALYDERQAITEKIMSGTLTPEENMEARNQIETIENQIKRLCGY